MNSDGRHVYLLHSRLSIIDLDKRANQPFCIGDYVLAFNGEIYNYVELKKELEERSYAFRTESDTEVLLRILIGQGWRGLDKCEGMWAFALYDQKDGSLILCRDRFGEKPLYFYKTDHGLYFGSEPKFIFTLLEDRLKINYDQLYRYMINGYKSLYKKGDTFFKGLREVRPGEVLIIHDDEHLIMSKYWHPKFEQDDSLSYNDAVEQTKESLINSVKLRLRSSVPLAFCMSGGVDSNSLISIAKRVLDYDVHGFTVVSEDRRYDELLEIGHVVKELNIKYTKVYIDRNGFLDNIRKLVVHHDAPVYTISYYLHWLLMSCIAEEGYKVSISGTGADELFTGYYDHFNQYLCEIWDSGDGVSALVDWTKYIAPFVRNPYLKNPLLYFKDSNFRDHIYLDNAKFAEYFGLDSFEEFAETNYTDSLLRNRMLNELFHESVPVILHEDDINAMYFSIENRSPFLDRSLFELSCRISTRYLIRDGYSKIVLRDAMKGIVPEKILQNRRKVGFNAPVHEFLDVKNKEVRESLLDDSPIFEHVKKGMMEKLIDKDYLENSESKFLFYFLNAKYFVEEFG